jgi:hypothetical protein
MFKYIGKSGATSFSRKAGAYPDGKSPSVREWITTGAKCAGLANTGT